MRKIWCKNFLTLHRYRDFRVGSFYCDSPCRLVCILLWGVLCERCRRYPDNCDSVNALLPKREFFMLFDELFSTQPKLSTDLHTRLMHIYPRLKVSPQLLIILHSSTFND